MSVGGGGSSGNSQTQLDPQVKADWQALFNRATQTANSGVPQQQFAGLNGQEQSAIGALNNAPSVGAGAIGTAIGRAGVVDGNVPLVYQKTANAFTYSPTAMSAAQINPSQVGSVTASTLPTSDLSGYLNPYNTDVFNTSLKQLDLARQQAINGNTDTANSQGGEGAWNGARAGVSDSLTNKNYIDQAGQLAANLNAQGFNTAAGLQQSDADRMLQAAEQNQQTGLNIAGQNAGFQQQAGQTNAAAANVAGATNAATENTNSQFNATQGQNAELANQAGYEAGQGITMQDAALLGNLGTTQQQQYITGQDAALTGGQTAQQNQQGYYNTLYQNQLGQQNLPLQQLESAFGIIPSTGSGSVTHSSGKSGNVGF